jgi:carboxypeptidase family protein
VRFLSLALLVPTAALAQQSAIVGRVLARDSGAAGACATACPLGNATVRIVRSDARVTRDAVTSADGAFRFDALGTGIYTATVHRLGYRSAELSGIRLATAQTVEIEVRLTAAPRQLSTIQVVASPITIDVMTPEIPVRLERGSTALLPTPRDASSLIALVPGARTNQLWGGAPGVSNDYQMDGVSINHPGLGGDVLALSVDWIESLHVRGLGAGAEEGNFQGGIINAITRTGGNERQLALRTNYESSRLTATNFNANEEGIEQAGRRELSGEALGPIARNRVFYFVAGQFIGRDFRSPNLTTTAPADFQSVHEEHRDGRGLAKVTWLPSVGQRVDLLGSYSSFTTQHAGINGVDDPTSTVAVRAPSTFYELSWQAMRSASNQLDVRLGGYTSRETRLGYGGETVPGVQLFQPGRMPTFQNSAFDERREPSSIDARAEWTTQQHFLGIDHRTVLGGDLARGRWRTQRTRNGGLTWRPYTTGVANFDPTSAGSWQTVGSDWGGEMRFDADDASEAVFLQEYATLGSRLTLSPGIRFGQWAGYVRPQCASSDAICYRFEAVHADGWDPRIGLSWDVTGRNTLALKAHWGRYHQGMYALFFDRAAGVNAYTNQRFYYTGPTLTDARQTYTPAERDAPNSGFGTFYDELILDESGRVEHYREPYVDQGVLALEKSIGSSWKVEISYANRRNGDMVGLVDRNLASNYTPLHNIAVEHRLVGGVVLDAKGQRLVLPTVYVSNNDLKALLATVLANAKFPPESLLGYPVAYINQLTWNPDLLLTTLPQAKRRYQQLTMLVRAYQRSWRGEASVTSARLQGNVPGVTGYGTSGSTFSAGPFVRPNEAINGDGYLPDALELEGKVWITAELPFSLLGGVLYTHTLGERFTPSFELLGRYRYTIDDGQPGGEVIPDEAMRSVLGQTILVEPRGSRQYASRDIVDAHLEWHARRGIVVLCDAFNLLGSNALLLLNTNIGDQEPSDPTSVFGAARRRVSPRTLRLGLRIGY